MFRRLKGFTLIELLIIIAIIGFLAAAILVAVDPVKRIKESRNTKRWEEVNSILNAILTKQVDERRLYDGAGSALIDDNFDTAQVIVRETDGAVCTIGASAPSCPGAEDRDLTIDYSGPLTCVVQLHVDSDAIVGYPEESLDPEFIAELPIDPLGAGRDPEVDLTDLPLGDNNTGYYMNRYDANRIEIGACHPELDASIRVAR